MGIKFSGGGGFLFGVVVVCLECYGTSKYFDYQLLLLLFRQLPV